MTRMPDNSVLLETLLDAAVDAIIVADAEGRMIRVNPAASAMFGYAPGEMIGQSVDLLIPGDGATGHGGKIARYLASGQARIIGIGRDVEAIRKDGSIFPVRLSVGRGTIGGAAIFVGILHDLTERRAAQQQMEALQRMEALARLTGGVAHDFNNVLTIIIGNLELLEAGLTDEGQRTLLHEALAAAELGTGMIEKLLAHGRRGNLQPVRLDVNATIRETIGLLRRTLSPATRLRAVLAADTWPIEADPVQLQNALINLVLNARDAMPEGGDVVVGASNADVDALGAAEAGTAPGPYVRISVTDNGQGMAPEVRRRAFEPFFTTKAPGKGTGLGLAAVYGFVRQSGGHASLYSEAGLGTTVRLHLPAAAGTTAATEDGPARTADDRVASGQTILVVEDDDAIRRLSTSRIEALGYRAIPAADAAQALDILARTPHIDALFTDIIMPGAMNGIALARKVRAENPDIAILLTSGFSGDLIHPDTGISANFQLLSKPYRQDELATRLRILLSGRASPEV